MKHLKHLFTALLLLCGVGTATAHHFEAGGIFYNITNNTNKTVEVTCKGYFYDSYSDEYTGSVVIPESFTYNGTTYSVTSIGEDAFYGCTGLTSIVIPNSVTSIGRSAFCGCCGLRSITIPNSVTSIGNYAFCRCCGLTSIIVDDNNTKYDSRENCNAIIETETNTLVWGCENTIIPNSVTSIGEDAFFGCTGLTSIVIPNGVTSIGRSAFSGCTGLTSIEIPNSVTSIGDYAFEHCERLASITIPNSVTSIGWEAFYYCTGLTSIEIPNSVTSIGRSAFSGCTGLTSIEIPNSVKTIGDYAFRGCSNVETLYIGGSVASIGDGAFAGCEKITEIKVALEKPISGRDNIFAEAVYDNATLYIPYGTKSLYDKRGPWDRFFYIKEMDFTGIEEVLDEVKAESGKVKAIYDLNGRVVENPSSGIYIINGKKILVK